MLTRVFSVGVLLTGSLLLMAPELIFSEPQAQWRVDGSRLNDHLQTLHRLVTTASGKASRVAFSDADRTGRSYVINLMRAAGLETQIDHAGNIMGRREGRASLTFAVGKKRDGPASITSGKSMTGKDLMMAVAPV